MNDELNVPEEILFRKIHSIGGRNIMFDFDLAELYQVETKRLNEQVKRNKERFPSDFMFQLSENQWKYLRSQNATATFSKRRTLPYAFTEEGVAMLSSVLKSQVAIAVHIQIIRVFTKMRALHLTHKDLLKEIDRLNQKMGTQDKRIDLIFNYLKQFVSQKNNPRKSIGFKP